MHCKCSLRQQASGAQLVSAGTSLPDSTIYLPNEAWLQEHPSSHLVSKKLSFSRSPLLLRTCPPRNYRQKEAHEASSFSPLCRVPSPHRLHPSGPVGEPCPALPRRAGCPHLQPDGLLHAQRLRGHEMQVHLQLRAGPHHAFILRHREVLAEVFQPAEPPGCGQRGGVSQHQLLAVPPAGTRGCSVPAAGRASRLDAAWGSPTGGTSWVSALCDKPER